MPPSAYRVIAWESSILRNKFNMSDRTLKVVLAYLLLAAGCKSCKFINLNLKTSFISLFRITKMV